MLESIHVLRGMNSAWLLGLALNQLSLSKIFWEFKKKQCKQFYIMQKLTQNIF